jgi:phosphonate transport system ATP-binding protein
VTEIFELNDAHVRFADVHALDGISLSVKIGERIALVGPSGAGKSTLLGLLNGSVLPTAGRARVLGQDLATLSGRARRQVQRQIGTVYQHLHLVGNLRVLHNVNAGHLGRWSFAKAAWSLMHPLQIEEARHALQAVGIPEKLHARTDTLSGGQQQRVAIARVLAQNPVAILADEPISSIDPERSREIMDLLRDLCQRLNKTLVVSLHTLAFAYSHVDRIVGLRAGRIIFDTSPAQVSQTMLDALYKIERAETDHAQA